MIELFDRFISMIVMADRTPIRFVVTSACMADAIDHLYTFDRERCNGHRANLQAVYLDHHPTPMVPTTGSDVFGYVLTVQAVRDMRAEAKRLGLSHYRGIPIVIDDRQSGVVLESRPWGEA